MIVNGMIYVMILWNETSQKNNSKNITVSVVIFPGFQADRTISAPRFKNVKLC